MGQDFHIYGSLLCTEYLEILEDISTYIEQKENYGGAQKFHLIWGSRRCIIDLGFDAVDDNKRIKVLCPVCLLYEAAWVKEF